MGKTKYSEQMKAAKAKAVAYAREGQQINAELANRERDAGEWVRQLMIEQRRDKLDKPPDRLHDMTQKLYAFKMAEAFKRNLPAAFAGWPYDSTTIYLSEAQLLQLLGVRNIPLLYLRRLLPQMVKENWTNSRAPATSWGAWELDKPNE